MALLSEGLRLLLAHAVALGQSEYVLAPGVQHQSLVQQTATVQRLLSTLSLEVETFRGKEWFEDARHSGLEKSRLKVVLWPLLVLSTPDVR